MTLAETLLVAFVVAMLLGGMAIVRVSALKPPPTKKARDLIHTGSEPRKGNDDG